MLHEGDVAPDFTLPTDGGGGATLSDYRGKKVVLYFYPKDDTPGCTTEACNFRDDYSQILAAGAAVLGVSPDTVTSHGKFKIKFGLPYALLSDPDHRVAEMYGAWGEKVLYGRRFVGMVRSTFIIGPTGQLLRVWKRARAQGHGEAVLAAIRDISNKSGSRPAAQG